MAAAAIRCDQLLGRQWKCLSRSQHFSFGCQAAIKEVQWGRVGSAPALYDSSGVVEAVVVIREVAMAGPGRKDAGQDGAGQ
jgi:hypothetical protein